MENTFLYKNKEYTFERYPKTQQRSLKAWNAADEHLVQHFDALSHSDKKLAIYNDRFGYLTCMLTTLLPDVVINYASQKKAILRNLAVNKLSENEIRFREPIEDRSEKINLAILKIPKSMDLFRLQLIQIAKTLEIDGTVLCGFMTKYFTPQILSVAAEFFENVEQSKAWKKSRVLTLKGLKPRKERSIINSIAFEDQIFQQYFGVFSAKNIDHASQFLIKNWEIKTGTKKILDLASGNGFLAKMIRNRNANCKIHLLDDDWLAVESSKLNFKQDDENTFFHFNDSLEFFEDGFFDLIVCNPPFHFEHETNIEVAIELFKEARSCLSEHGSLQIVANRHLNYRTHLIRLFEKVEITGKDKKFEIINCELPAG